MNTFKLMFFILFSVSISINAQNYNQTIRGVIQDEATGSAVPFANIVIKNSNPLLGTTSDTDGKYTIKNVPVGRYDIEITCIGYDPVLQREMLISSSKELVLNVTMHESVIELGEISVKPKTNKESTVNSMSLLSSRMLSVEEAQRYAGGFDDPARLASSFAGVASNVGNNGIIVRGNAPHNLLWRMEGVEIPNPNHFADMSAFGAGGLTALSSNLLANSDFFTGAFPAEYGNATSGVFDIFMRTGNNHEYEHTFQAGGIGIDFSSEGPFKKGNNASYLFNYRYSTLALLTPLLPDDADGTAYQDLAFKLNFPTKKSGVFSLWGIGLYDRSGAEPETDSLIWYYDQDKQKNVTNQFMGTIGLTHKIKFGNHTNLNSSLTITGNGLDYYTKELGTDLQLYDLEKINNICRNLILSSQLNHKFSAKHSNRSGVTITNLHYNLLLENALHAGEQMQTVAEEKANSYLISAYTSSKFSFSEKVTATAGIYSQFFTLNRNYTIEPRLSVNWQVNETSSVGAAYGKHSRIERLNIYFVKNDAGEIMNKNLDFFSAHHFVLNYSRKIGENSRLVFEPYYQVLTKLPVEPGTYFSTINLKDYWFVNVPLVNKGKGYNYGMDFTLERFLNKGYYYLITASLFQSKYKGGDNIWRNTRYNRNYLFNVLAGKEWQTGKNRKNTFNMSGRLSFQGGDKIIPVDYEASGNTGDIVYDYKNAFNESLDPMLLLHFTVNYKINKKKHASTWAMNVINATGVKEFYGYRRNLQTGTIEPEMEAIVIPNVSYKIEF